MVPHYIVSTKYPGLHLRFKWLWGYQPVEDLWITPPYQPTTFTEFLISIYALQRNRVLK